MEKNNLTQTSKFISLILRHKPETIGIKLDEHGWADVEDLLKGADIDFSTLEQIVKEDEKGRYSFSDDKTKIRANQGHSIRIMGTELIIEAVPFLLWEIGWASESQYKFLRAFKQESWRQ